MRGGPLPDVDAVFDGAALATGTSDTEASAESAVSLLSSVSRRSGAPDPGVRRALDVDGVVVDGVG